jgi:outer membrane biosynthesis protein TonB
MNETAKTLTFVAVGAVALLSAYFINAGSQPVEVEDRVGTSLNADVNIDDPQGMKIVKFDRATGATRQFEVASIDGVWRIPSKQDYPADATQQMAAAANALIDRKILRVAAETADAHATYGVVDPLSAKLDSSSEGVGTRVVMNDADDKPIIDMIVGKKVKEAEGQRYVRMSNQDVVYVVELDADSLSTNFEDWIEDDLLKLSPFDVSQVFINDYSAELSLGLSPDGQIVRQVSWDRRGEATLDYDNEQSKWELEDLKKFDQRSQKMVEDKLADDEEVNQEALNKLRTGLDELLIVDVVKKPAGLSGDLKAGGDFLKNREAQADLMSKGFAPVPLKEGAPPEILSSEGEVIATQRDGVEYVLRFGRLQVQTDSAADGDDPAGDAAAEAKAAADGDEQNLRRYLFVTARFNEDAIEKPKLQELPAAEAPAEKTQEAEAPATAETPAEATPSEAAPAEEAAGDAAPTEPAAEAPAAEEAPGGDQPEAAGQLEPTDEQSPEEPEKSEDPAAEPAAPVDAAPVAPAETSAAAGADKPAAPAADADPLAAARAAVEQENKRLEEDYQRSVEEGRKRVAELNERFGDWYYVISNDVYKQIHLNRGDIIKKKEPAAGEAGAAAEANPLSGLPNLPGAPAQP